MVLGQKRCGCTFQPQDMEYALNELKNWVPNGADLVVAKDVKR